MKSGTKERLRRVILQSIRIFNFDINPGRGHLVKLLC
jgi:hypothetical protein